MSKSKLTAPPEPLKTRTNATLGRIERLVPEMFEITQPSSDFVLDHFHIASYDTPYRQRVAVLSELLDRAERLDNLRRTLYPAGVEDAPVSPFYRTQVELQITGILREVDHLLAVLDKLPKFTREQYEEQEKDYWSRRLVRQAMVQKYGTISGIGPANLDAIIQYYVEPGQIVDPLTTIQQALQILGTLENPPQKEANNAEPEKGVPPGE